MISLEKMISQRKQNVNDDKKMNSKWQMQIHSSTRSEVLSESYRELNLV